MNTKVHAGSQKRKYTAIRNEISNFLVRDLILPLIAAP